VAASIKGVSTTSCPIQPRPKESHRKIQNSHRFSGLKYALRNDEVSTRGRIARITIEIPIIATPPSLSGIVRSTA